MSSYTLMEFERHHWSTRDHVTLVDVAKAAGVSQSAASVVLNGAQSGTRISATRRRAILETAQRMGYRPNALARSLITGRTNLVGVYSGRSVLDSRNSFFAELLGGVFDGAAESGANTVVRTSRRGVDDLLDLVSNRILDGLVTHAGKNDPILGLLGEFRIPAVAVADAVDGLPSVVVDDAAGGLMQAQHLSMLGHQHVMVKETPFASRSAEDRMSSFKEAAARLGIRVTSRIETFQEGDGLDADDIRILTEGSERATAVVGWSDDVAQRICNKLIALGVPIPEEVSVIGFDGFPTALTQTVRLTTIRAPWAEVGRLAAKFVTALVEHQSVPNLTVLPVEFVRGNTT